MNAMDLTNVSVDPFSSSYFRRFFQNQIFLAAINEKDNTSSHDTANDSLISVTSAEGFDVSVNETLNLMHVVFTCSILSVIILATIVGNVFVIAAIVLERNLQNVANYLIASLAVADLMVAILVMPLAAVKEVSSHWFLGKEVCDMFISSDVLCCTSSILHLVAISVDRYWAVTRVDYIHNRPVRLIIAMIALSWGISTIISIPPLFGWRDPLNNPDDTGECLISQDWGYTIYSTVGAFYIPLVIMLIIYLNVYRAARGRIRKKHFRTQESSTSSSILVKKSSGARGRYKFGSCSTPPTMESPSTPSSVLTTLPPNGTSTPPPQTTVASRGEAGTRGDGKGTAGGADADGDGGGGGDGSNISVMTSLIAASSSSPLSYEFNGNHWLDHDDQNAPQLETSFRSAERKIREKKEQARERKAARTLAIITGSFVMCWLPFFIIALIGPFCGPACPLPSLLVSVIGWLGYFNSLLNPVIYTIFNPDFRSAFQKILFGSYRNRQSFANKVLNASASLTGSRRTAS